MKNQKAVFVSGDEFNCTQFFDVDKQQDGVDVEVNGKHLGQIFGLTIPEIDDEEANIDFDKAVEEWVLTESNYL